MVPSQRLLWDLNFSICWTKTQILRYEHCVVLTPIESGQVLLSPICVKNGTLGLPGLLQHLWVSEYDCLVKVPQKSFRATGNREQISQSQIQHLKHFNYVTLCSEDCHEWKLFWKCSALCTLFIVGCPQHLCQTGQCTAPKSAQLHFCEDFQPWWVWLTTTAKGCSFFFTQLLLLQVLKRNAYEYFSWPWDWLLVLSWAFMWDRGERAIYTGRHLLMNAPVVRSISGMWLLIPEIKIPTQAWISLWLWSGHKTNITLFLTHVRH